MVRVRAVPRTFRALQIHQTVRRELEYPLNPGPSDATPYRAWLAAAQKIPPAEVLTRPLAVQHAPYNGGKGGGRRVGRQAFRMPQSLEYVEDGLRRRFYKDHPWELARPRVVVELDGKDAQSWDWSKGIRQPGMQLTGESVVQRQKWLMTERGLTLEAAYDVARKELYADRHEEAVTQRVAQEEARHVGAYFGPSMLRYGMRLEDAKFDEWKVWAQGEAAREARSTAAQYTDFREGGDDVAGGAGGEEAGEEL